MITHRGFSAWIVSEDSILPEYLVSIDSNTNQVSCWIPSKAGKTFSVHWRDAGTQQYSCAFICLDGFLVPGRFLMGYGDAWRSGVRTGDGSERPFMFTEQMSTVSEVQLNRNLGAIALKIRLVSLNGQKQANPVQQLPEPFGSSSNTTGHCISYGPERNTHLQSPLTWRVEPLSEMGNRSFVTFIFRYGPRELLLSNGIISTEDAFQIPPAVQMSCMMTSQVARAPVTSGSTTAATSNGMSSAQVGEGSAPRNAPDTRSRPVRKVRNVRKASSRPTLYPGEGILVLARNQPRPDGNAT